MRQILIPFDFSETAENALQYTISLFEDEAIEITLLNIYISKRSALMSDEYNDDWLDDMDDSAVQTMKSYVTNLNKMTNDSYTFKGIVKANTFVNAIKDVATNERIDLIVTGTEGAHTLTEEFIGTRTLKIINQIKTCPIIVVPYNYNYVPLHQIVFSTSFKRVFTHKELKPLIHLAFKKDSLLEVVWLSDEQYLTDRQKANKIQLETILDGFDVAYKKIDWQDSETNSLELHVKDTNSELLAIINHKQNFFNRLTEENVIKKSVFHSTIPLLILPEVI